MAGESPLNMMQPRAARSGPQQRQSAALPQRRKRGSGVLPIVLGAAAIAALAGGWTWLWYNAAAVADRTLSGWVQREATAGRVYSCGSQDITGYPFRIQAHCVEAGAQINSNQPPFAVNAKDITFAAQVYHPTTLVAHVTGPLTLSVPGQPPSFTANWTGAEMTVSGVPPEPESVSVSVDDPKVEQSINGNSTTIFTATSAGVESKIVSGSAANNPVIDTLIDFTSAVAPTVHPLLAQPVLGRIDTVFTGFKDITAKPWAQHFREMQAAGGGIQIKRLRLESKDWIIVGEGELKLNDDGKLEGLIRIAISGVEKIVPQLGVDRAIDRTIDRLGGDKASQGLSKLDQLMPGLGGAIRNTATSTIIDSLNKMGQPTSIDDKPAILLPLRVSDGSAYLGMIPLGDLPPLF